MTIVCVTGMHRSGTSLVARVVNLLGVDLGSRDMLMPPKVENPRGFWENQDIVRVNERVLRELGGNWADPPPMPAGWETWERVDRLRNAGAQALEDAFGSVEDLLRDDVLVGWKDPRMSLLLPFWSTIVPIRRCIVTVRDPREVAASLQARGDVEPNSAGRLWIVYVATALCQSVDCCVVRYEEFFEDLGGVVDRLVGFLGAEAPTPHIMSAIADAVDPTLRRSAPVEIDGAEHLRASVQLDDLLAREGHRSVRPLLRELSLLAGVGRAHEEISRLRESMDQLEERLLESRRQVERLEGHVNGWEQQHEKLREEHQAFRRHALAERQRLIDERDEQTAATERMRRERDERTATCKRLRRERDGRTVALERTRRALRVQTERARSREREARRLRMRLAELNTLLAAADLRAGKRHATDGETDPNQVEGR